MDNNILSVNNLTVSINKSIILSNISLRINKGDFIFLKGSNGSGKTTFLNVLSGKNQDGKYAVNGNIIFNNEYNIINSNRSDEYRRQKHFIEQIEHDFGETVFDKFYITMNGVLSNSLSTQDILTFFNKYHINDYFEDQSIKHILKRKLYSLSEGQKKIVSLISGFMRAQYMKILIADEPLNHLDSGNIKKTIDLFTGFRSMFPELAIIITTHCQAFPEPTKYLLLKDKNIFSSPAAYHQYDCFNELIYEGKQL
jgi:ABC-type multidrug transport system ATPase subunit